MIFARDMTFFDWFGIFNEVTIGIAQKNYLFEKYIPNCVFYRPARLVRLLRGGKMQSTPSLMNEFGAALQFPECFGENWLALEDCLCSLDECKPFSELLIIISDSSCVLSEDKEAALHALLLSCYNASLWWQQPITDEYDRHNNRDSLLCRFLFVVDDPGQREKFLKRVQRTCDLYTFPANRFVLVKLPENITNQHPFR